MQTQVSVRPDSIYKTGVIQPFSVITDSPVSFARQEIDPFINAIRPMGSQLGIVSPEVLRTLGQAEAGADTPATPATEIGLLKVNVAWQAQMITDQAATIATMEKNRWLWLLGGLVLGGVGGYFATKMMRKRG